MESNNERWEMLRPTERESQQKQILIYAGYTGSVPNVPFPIPWSSISDFLFFPSDFWDLIFIVLNPISQGTERYPSEPVVAELVHQHEWVAIMNG